VGRIGCALLTEVDVLAAENVGHSHEIQAARPEEIAHIHIDAELARERREKIGPRCLDAAR